MRPQLPFFLERLRLRLLSPALTWVQVFPLRFCLSPGVVCSRVEVGELLGLLDNVDLAEVGHRIYSAQQGVHQLEAGQGHQPGTLQDHLQTNLNNLQCVASVFISF